MSSANRSMLADAARVAGRWLAAALLLSAWLGAAAVAPADGVARHALVIGNSSYKTMPLENPVNDARAMADALAQLGFRVVKLENASQRQIYEAIRAFGDSLGNGVGLFYYAGHGVQVKGQNYLIPVDSAIEREDEIAYKAVNAGQVLEKMQTAKNPLNIVILDACSNDPFKRASRSGAMGLASMEAPAGALIAFATAPGGVASDGTGKNGVYTKHLLANMAMPGLKVEDVFKRVRTGVKQETNSRQIPWENTSLEGDFYFVPSAAGAAAQAPAPAPTTGGAVDAVAAERELWDQIQDSRNPSDFKAYLERYPRGQFAALARGRIERVEHSRTNAAASSTAVVTAQSDTPRSASNFSFSAEEEKMLRAEDRRRDGARAALSASCPAARKAARIRLEVNEQYLSGLSVVQQRAGGSLANAIADRLRAAGLKVAGTGAAEYVLRGMITSQTNANRFLRLNELSLSTAVAITGPSGQTVSSVVSRDESYAGSDVYGAFVDLVTLQADDVAARLYAEYCQGT